MNKLRRVVPALVGACLAAVLVPAPSASAALVGRPDPSGPAGTLLLQRPAHGAAAIERLGDDIGRAARLNSMTVTELERLLLDDRTAWVHPTGRIYYVDPAPDGIVPRTPERAPYPYDQTFQLHSRPGASRTIYIDFDGQTVSGTAWNTIAQFSLPASTHPAFSLDGDSATFSNAERDVIQSVWQRVSEDYAPFDVDVTTADPGPSGLVKDFDGDPTFGTRALVTPSEAAIQGLCGGGCGGIAFIGTYGIGSAQYQPAWIFPQALSYDTKAIAEAVSHEVGHNLGLEHDGAPGETYYQGQGSWAPIMGGSYDRPISQWSQGEYTGASNTQDDLAVITENGLSTMADDHGGTVEGATQVTSPDRTATGLVASADDKDVFAFPQGCDGPVTVTVTPAPTSPDLDVRLRILGADGGQLAVANPASGTSTYDVASGMGAAATVPATSGVPLFAEVDGVGAGNPATNGYSDYASLGRYTITSTGCGPAATPVVAFQTATRSVDEGAGTAQLTVTRTGDTTVATSVAFARTGGTAVPGDDFTLTSGRLDFAAGQTQRTIPVSVADDALDEPSETVQVTLSAPATGTSLGSVTTSTLTIVDDDTAAGGRPDLLISKRQGRGYVGDDVYNADGALQTLGSSSPRGRLRTFYVEVTNDGPASEVVALHGQQTGKALTVTYSNNGNDITQYMRSGTAQAELAPGEVAIIRVDMWIGRKAAVGSKKSVWVTATSADGLRTDVVAGTVRVKRS